MKREEQRVSWADVVPPIVEVPSRQPQVSADIYQRRLIRLRDRMNERGLDAVVVYADREHSANFSYLAGFGPRFEEALLVVGRQGVPLALLAAENIGMVDFTPVDLRSAFFPTFGLLGQPRQDVRSIDQLLAEGGIARGSRVGTIGWKYYTSEDGCPFTSIEIPHFIVEAIASVTGATVENVTDILMAPDGGLRTVLDVEEVVLYEHAAAVAAEAVLAVMDAAEPGKSEVELAAPLSGRGLPLSAHPMLSVGEKARFGLTSPSDLVSRRGDFLTTAFGVEGGLSCRAAYLASGPEDLSEDVRHWLERVASPFFFFAAKWLQTVRIGLNGSEIWNLAERLLPRETWGWELNPGHYIAQDEWISTPFTQGSTATLKSGNYVQLDLIINPKRPYFGANLEDGVVLADDTMRQELKSKHPDVWQRFMRRRTYLQQRLGIALGSDVLPMSDILGYYRPFLLKRGKALTLA